VSALRQGEAVGRDGRSRTSSAGTGGWPAHREQGLPIKCADASSNGCLRPPYGSSNSVNRGDAATSSTSRANHLIVLGREEDKWLIMAAVEEKIGSWQLVI
jgi:hypothetical protein